MGPGAISYSKGNSKDLFSICLTDEIFNHRYQFDSAFSFFVQKTSVVRITHREVISIILKLHLRAFRSFCFSTLKYLFTLKLIYTHIRNKNYVSRPGNWRCSTIRQDFCLEWSQPAFNPLHPEIIPEPTRSDL